MLGSPGLDHMSNGGSDLKYGNAECYSPKYDHRDYKGKHKPSNEFKSIQTFVW